MRMWRLEGVLGGTVGGLREREHCRSSCVSISTKFSSSLEGDKDSLTGGSIAQHA